MPNSLFNFPSKLPAVPQEISMYRTGVDGALKSYSGRVGGGEFSERVKLNARLFKTSTAAQDFGHGVLFREADHTLEIFRPSQSLRWTHGTLAYRERPAGALPQERDVETLADKALRDHQIDRSAATFRHVVYSQTATATAAGARGKLENTEAHAVYRFGLDGIPVVGPGAKLRVSFVEQGQMSQMLSFWRTPQKDKPMRLRTPKDALDRFAQDPRFMRLSPDSALVDVGSVELAYYATSPSEFQRYLVPVYTIRGDVRTPELPHDQFKLHVVAVDLTPEQVKKLAPVANPGSCVVF